MNNFIFVDFQTHVSIWFLISMKFCIRIINKKGGYESAIAPKVFYKVRYKVIWLICLCKCDIIYWLENSLRGWIISNNFKRKNSVMELFFSSAARSVGRGFSWKWRPHSCYLKALVNVKRIPDKCFCGKQTALATPTKKLLQKVSPRDAGTI